MNMHTQKEWNSNISNFQVLSYKLRLQACNWSYTQYKIEQITVDSIENYSSNYP